MKYVISVILLIMTANPLLSQTVAHVGEFQISQQELADEMNNFADLEGLTYKQVRQMALDNLIEKYLLMNYARENNIQVDEVELEAFFMRELGELPRFQTNGQFSVAKYRVFIETPNGQIIKKEMEKEILINKTKTLIENSFDIEDEQLFHQFLLEKIVIDLGYAIIDVQDANVTDNITLREAQQYYLRNRDKYAVVEKVKLAFFLIFKDDFLEEVQDTVDLRLNNIAEMDTTLTFHDLSRLQSVLSLEEAAFLAHQQAVELTQRFQNRQNISKPILESSYLRIDEKSGNIPNSVIKQAFQMKKGDHSQPIDIGKAFITFRVVDKKEFRNKNETEVANLVWRDYLVEKKRSFRDYRDYFDNNIDRFTVDVAVVNIVNISQPPRFSSISKQEFVEKMRSSIQANIDDPLAVQKILKENGLKFQNRILYLETFENENVVENAIARMVGKNSLYGFLPTTDGLVFFQVLSYFPSFIPRYEDIRDQMPNFIVISQTDTTEFRQYYEEHKKDFLSPDSLKLGGIHFSIAEIADTLNIEITEQEIREIYEKDIDTYYRKRSVQFDYIYVQNEEKATLVHRQLIKGIPFSLLKFSFHEEHSLSHQIPVQYDDLPRVIRESLSRMLEGSIYQPVSYDEGWFILNKIKEHPAGIIQFADIKPQIEKNLKMLYAQEEAYLAAKTIFDSTSYFSHLFKYFEDKDIFETAYQNADDEFEILGSLKEHKSDLMRIWRNEKYSSIIRTQEGFAVVFVLKKHLSSQQSFEESLPAIEAAIAAKGQFENARRFVNTLRNSIVAGENPEDLMLFFGGWKRARNLNLSSKIPGIDFSKDIMSDILSRSETYCSPVITLNPSQLFFYLIERYNKPDTTVFYENKNKFRQNYVKQRYRDWLAQYRARVNIDIFH